MKRIFSTIILVFALIPQLAFATSCGFGSDIGGGLCRGYLTSGSTWTVPSDWTSSNTIEAIGGGAGGQAGAAGTGGKGGVGGGGGQYGAISNLSLTPGSSVQYAVGGGGAGGTGSAGLGGAGGDTYFNGTARTNASLGVAGSTGSVGANGGTSHAPISYAGGGGGGAILGAHGGAGGGAGGSNVAVGGSGGITSSTGGSGGGGTGNAKSGTGANCPSPNGSNGGSAPSGTAGIGGTSTSAATSGTNGGGGGGGASTVNVSGARGSTYAIWDATHGSGGAGGGGGGSTLAGATGGNGGSAANYGGGGGGGGGASNPGTGGSGAPGIIVITYTPAANQAPASPVIAGPTTLTQGGAGTYLFQASDPNGDTIRYGIDWNNDGTIDEWVPALGYVSSGTQSSTSHTWNTSGSQTFEARTQDVNGSSSGWTAYSVTVTAPAPTALLTTSLDPNDVYGGSGTVALTWSSSNASSCTGTNFAPGGATGGAVTVTPTQTTTYTVTCTGSGGSAQSSKTITYACTPQHYCSGNNLRYINSSCVDTLSQTCSYQCTTSGCIAPPPPQFNQGANGSTGHLRSSPALSVKGRTVNLYWDVSNVSSCSISGDNGDVWNCNGAGNECSSGRSGQTTSAISGLVNYTLSCNALPGVSPASFEESINVNIVPTFHEL